MANNNRRRNVQTTYNYDLNDRSGTIDIGTSSAPAHIEYADDDLESHTYAIQLDHPNYLPLNMVHVQGNVNTRTRRDSDTSDRRPDIRVHNRPECTYQQYVDHLRISNVTPILLYSVVGEAQYYYVPEQFRMLIRGAVKLLLHIHSEGRALKSSSLSLHNLHIRRGEVKITGVDFVRVQPTTKTDLFKQDWFLLNRLTLDIFDAHRQQIPEDMTRLQRCMHSYTSWNDEAHMKYHLALMTSSERINFIENCWEKRVVIESLGFKNAYQDAILDMGNYTGWVNQIFYNAQNPIFSVVKSCFEHGEDDPLLHYVDSSRFAANKSILKCARNIATHLHEHIDPNNGPFGDREIDIMLMSTFGGAIVAIHHQLSRRLLLKYIIQQL